MINNDSSIYDDNIDEFIKKYGSEGFLQLFLENYLYELIQYFLHSEMKGDDDLSRAYYIDYKGEIYKYNEIDTFEKNLKKECKKRATLIIEELKSRNMIDNINVNIIDRPEVKKIVIRHFENILSRFSGV